MRHVKTFPITRQAAAFSAALGFAALLLACQNPMETVSPPFFSPSTGAYDRDQLVTLYCATPGAAVSYTTDGSDPTSSSTAYGDPIAVAGNGAAITLKAIATASGMTASSVASATYTINYSQVSTPQFSPWGGSFSSARTVTISTATPGASIRFTTGGGTPTSADGTIYTGPISVSGSRTIMAVAYKTGLADSTVSSAVFSIPQYFVYVANEGGNNVSACTINTSTGALTPVSGSPYAAGNVPVSVAVDPTGKFVYVANYFGGNVSAYTINTDTGALTPVSGSPYAAGSQPISVAVDPTGKFVHVANYGGDNVSAYTINTSTGALTPVSGSPYAAGNSPYSVAVDPAGKFVYVINYIDNNVSAYTINTSTGALTPVSGSPYAAGNGPYT